VDVEVEVEAGKDDEAKKRRWDMSQIRSKYSTVQYSNVECSLSTTILTVNILYYTFSEYLKVVMMIHTCTKAACSMNIYFAAFTTLLW
jgi:hypothetical protein